MVSDLIKMVASFVCAIPILAAAAPTTFSGPVTGVVNGVNINANLTIVGNFATGRAVADIGPIPVGLGWGWQEDIPTGTLCGPHVGLTNGGALNGSVLFQGGATRTLSIDYGTGEHFSLSYVSTYSGTGDVVEVVGTVAGSIPAGSPGDLVEYPVGWTDRWTQVSSNMITFIGNRRYRVNGGQLQDAFVKITNIYNGLVQMPFPQKRIASAVVASYSPTSGMVHFEEDNAIYPDVATATFNGLLNTQISTASLTVISNRLLVSNIGSSGQDGVEITLGKAVSGSVELSPVVPVPVGGWVQIDATGSLGGLTNHPVGTLRVTHDSTNTDGYAVTADLSAISSPTAKVQVWNNNSLVASFSGHTGMVARVSSMPIEWGKLGPITGLPPFYGCIVIYHPPLTDIWVNGVHFVGNELRVLQEAGPEVDYLSAFSITAQSVDSLNVIGETMVGLPATISGLLNTPTGNASLTVLNLGSSGQDGVSVANLGSSGQDGVEITLGRAESCSIGLNIPTIPIGGWAQVNVKGSLAGTTNVPVGMLRVTHDTTNSDGYAVTADLSAISSPTAKVQVWNNNTLVASFSGHTGMVARASAMIGGCGKLGPITNLPPFYGCIWVKWPPLTDIWINNIHFVGNELRVLQETGPTIDYLSAFSIATANLGSLQITNESMVGLPTTFAGHLNTPVGNATVRNLGTNGQDGVEVANLGSSGQDGVSISLGHAVSCTFGLNLPTTPIGGWLQVDATGSLGGLTNRPVGTLRVTHDTSSADGYAVTADLSAISSPTAKVQVWNNNTLVASFPGHTGMVARVSSMPIGCGKLGPITGLPPFYGCIVIYHPPLSDFWVNGIHFVGNELRVLQEAGPTIDYLSAFTITAANLPSFQILSETVVPLRPTLTVSRIGGNTVVVWPFGGILQQSTNLISWTDLPTATSPYTNVINPATKKLFYQVRQ